MKTTRATFKTFIKKNAGALLVSQRSSFDSMVDGCTSSADKSFKPARPSDIACGAENTFGIAGVWLVGGGRDYFTPFETEELTGIEVCNSCGHFFVAISK